MSEVMEKAEKPAKKALKQYKIMFHGEGGDVEIGHNYKLNLYKRGVWVPIDENFLAALKDTVIHTVVQDADGKNKNIRIPTYTYDLEPV